MARETAHRRLYRSQDAYLAGVCAGFAERFDMDVVVMRVLAILLTLSTFGLAAIVYLGLWAYLPRKSESAALYDVRPERAESSAFGLIDCIRADNAENPVQTGLSLVARLAVAVAVMLLFMGVAVNVSPMVSGASWWQFWPVGALMAGLCLTVIPLGGENETEWHCAGVALMSASAMILPMSLGVVAWETIPFAFERLWALVALAVVLFAAGYLRDMGALMVAGALCFAACCLLALAFYSIPGAAEALTVIMPDGNELRIVFVEG